MTKSRVEDTLSCDDCVDIPKVKNAGKIVEVNGRECQVMHNGLLIYKDSYHTFLTEVIRKSKGHHEPQEERVFYELLKHIPKNGLMIELGSYWAYYSMWFQKEVKGAKNYLIEPYDDKLKTGKDHFKLNGMKGDFTKAYIGKTSKKSVPFVLDDADGSTAKIDRVSIRDFMDGKNIDFATLVHSDIQGAEYDMLLGSPLDRVGCFVISTHGEFLHRRILDLLKKNSFRLVAEHTPGESHSADGLIVATVYDMPAVSITKKRTLVSQLKKLIGFVYVRLLG